jgi:DNA-binding XRE family transcriptional regulator
MKNRVFSLIEDLQLTPTEFADLIGVSRASISSIKTGRTQPTLTLVEKIKQHFPDTDINWLIFGEKEKSKEPTLFDTLTEEKNTTSLSQSTQTSQQAEEYQAVYIAEQAANKLTSNIEKNPNALNSDVNSSKLIEISKERNISKVLILYSDGSFEEFHK